MITTIFTKFIGDAFKEVHRLQYRNGSIVERIHTPGNTIPEDIVIVRPDTRSSLMMNQECQAYCHHYNVQL